HPRHPHSFPTRRSSDLERAPRELAHLANLALPGQKDQDIARALAPQLLDGRDDRVFEWFLVVGLTGLEPAVAHVHRIKPSGHFRSEEHTSELQSPGHLV